MLPKTKWLTNSFEELDTKRLYEILRLRSDVFVVEQECVFLDLDNKDQKAIHIQGYVDDRLVAYCRLFKAGDYFDDVAVSRVVVNKEYRRHGYAHELMTKTLQIRTELWGECAVEISAQLYLQNFYERHGFERIGDVYILDGLEHIQMKWKIK